MIPAEDFHFHQSLKLRWKKGLGIGGQLGEMTFVFSPPPLAIAANPRSQPTANPVTSSSTQHSTQLLAHCQTAANGRKEGRKEGSPAEGGSGEEATNFCGSGRRQPFCANLLGGLLGGGAAAMTQFVGFVPRVWWLTAFQHQQQHALTV
jgi:hypothetical protein